MSDRVSVVQCWGGCPRSATSKWQRFLAIVRRCHQQGWRNYLVLSKMPDDRELSEPFERVGCEIMCLPRSKGNFDVGSIGRLWRLLRYLKCDIFHCHNDHTSPLIGAAMAGAPVRVWSKLSMSSYYETATRPRGVQHLYASNRVSSCFSHRVLTLTETSRQEFIRQGGSVHKTVVVSGPVDVERFASASSDGVRERLGLPKPTFLIATVGHAVPVKGWDILLRAFARVAGGRDDLHLLLVGSTTSAEERPFTEGLSGIVNQSGCGRQVHFLGHRSDIAEILKASDLFVFPSRSDGQGLALVEAMAAGLPCLGAATGGILDVITDGVNGLLFERENVEDLAAKLSHLLRDECLRARLAAGALESAKQYTMDAYVERVFQCYQSLLALNTSWLSRRVSSDE